MVNGAPLIITDPQMVTLHTYSGVQLRQFVAHELIGLSWSRESCEVSQCKATVASHIDDGQLPEIVPWLHWVSVWDTTETLLWRGPIVDVEADRQTMTLDCRDIAAWFAATRCPLGKRWDAADPALIAEELVAAMIENNAFNAKVVTRPDPFGDRFDHTTVADETMLNQTIADLVHLGLHWTVVAGTILLGPMPRTPVATLGEDDFVNGGMALKRDGSQMFNDILVRGAGVNSRARTPMGGLNRQTIYNVDSMSSLSNVDRAARQAARSLSKIHDTIVLPDNAALDPHAPITLDTMIPSARVSIEAFGRIIPMELTGLDVRFTPQASTVTPRLAVVDDDLPELVEIQQHSPSAGLSA